MNEETSHTTDQTEALKKKKFSRRGTRGQGRQIRETLKPRHDSNMSEEDKSEVGHEHAGTIPTILNKLMQERDSYRDKHELASIQLADLRIKSAELRATNAEQGKDHAEVVRDLKLDRADHKIMHIQDRSKEDMKTTNKLRALQLAQANFESILAQNNAMLAQEREDKEDALAHASRMEARSEFKDSYIAFAFVVIFIIIVAYFIGRLEKSEL